MPLYNITLKPDAPDVELENAKKEFTEKGGTIRHSYSLIKGFTIEFPDDTVQTLESTEHVHVEQDGAMNTQ